MRRCECGASISLMSLFEMCDPCLRSYLAELPARPGLSIGEFQREQQHARQSIGSHTSVAPSQVRLCGTTLDPVTLPEALATVERFADDGYAHHVVTVNVDFVRIAQHNEQFRAIINNADLSIADGKPLQWAARWTGQDLPARITGMDLVLGAAELAVQRRETIFFLGAASGIAAKAATVLRQRYPGLSIQSYSPPMGAFGDEENARMLDLIQQSGATYLFVALGSPRGQTWIDEHLHALGVPVCAEVGGVFNFLAGTIKRAPAWMQQSGLEWLYRIAQEPSRLWRRYLVEDLPVFVQMLTEPIVQPDVALARPAFQPQPAPYEYEAAPLLERAVGGS